MFFKYHANEYFVANGQVSVVAAPATCDTVVPYRWLRIEWNIIRTVTYNVLRDGRSVKAPVSMVVIEFVARPLLR